MFLTWFRMSGTLLCGAGALMAYAQGQERAGLFLALFAGLLVYGHVRYAEVGTAWKADARGDHARARRLLERTPFGGRLLVGNHRASYHLLWARLLLREDRVDEAIAATERALRISTTPHNRAMGHALRAACHLDREEIEGAEAELAKARALRPKASLAPSLQRIAASIETLREGQDGGGADEDAEEPSPG